MTSSTQSLVASPFLKMGDLISSKWCTADGSLIFNKPALYLGPIVDVSCIEYLILEDGKLKIIPSMYEFKLVQAANDSAG